jgi:hypothetical protein
MTFEIEEILRSKRAYRRQLAARPVADKLRLLDQLRERNVAIAASRARKASAMEVLERKANSDEMKVGITD